MYEKEFGGLGIPNLQEINLCLLGSWVKRYYEGEEKPWKMIIGHKYMSGRPNIFSPNPNPDISRFWKGVRFIIQALKFGYGWKVGVGDNIRFWEDTWFDTSPLAAQFWPIDSVCNEQTKSIKDVWDGRRLKLSFRRNFDNKLMEQWYQLVEIVAGVVFSTDPDALVWQLENKGQHSTSYLYHVIKFRGV